MELRQALKQKNHMLVLDFPIWMRIVLGAISLLMIIPMIMNKQVNILPFLFGLFSGIGALYVEKWMFDTDTGKIVNETGLLVAFRTKTIQMAEVEGIKVDAPSPVAGKQPRFKSLVLSMKEGVPVVLEVQKRKEELTKYADLIAAATGLTRLDDSI